MPIISKSGYLSKQQRKCKLTGTVTYSLLDNMFFTIAFRDFEFLSRHILAHFTQVKIPTNNNTITPATIDVLIKPRYACPDYIKNNILDKFH